MALRARLRPPLPSIAEKPPGIVLRSPRHSQHPTASSSKPRRTNPHIYFDCFCLATPCISPQRSRGTCAGSPLFAPVVALRIAQKDYAYIILLGPDLLISRAEARIRPPQRANPARGARARECSCHPHHFGMAHRRSRLQNAADTKETGHARTGKPVAGQKLQQRSRNRKLPSGRSTPGPLRTVSGISGHTLSGKAGAANQAG